MPQSRIAIALAAGAVWAAGLLVSGRPARATAGDANVHPSGILIVAPPAADLWPAEPSPAVAAAWSEAYDLALKNPDDFGYPTVAGEGAKASVILRAATRRGAALASQATLGTAADGSPLKAVRASAFSFAQLEAAKHAAIGADEAVLPSASAIWATLPNLADNRVLLLVDTLHEDLLYALADHYDPRMLEVAVQPRVPMNTMIGRQADEDPYFGGSRRGFTDKANGSGSTCSDAFAWGWSGTYALLTAGHCARNGARVYEASGRSLGDVRDWVEENWSNGGTHGFNGSATLRGDLALIRVEAGKTSSPYIYRGGSDSTRYHRVSGRTGWSGIGNGYCVGGQRSGEICGFRVLWTGIDFDYLNDGVIRNAVWGRRYGIDCPNSGDSGGSVFEARSDGTVWAKGVFSGSTGDLLVVQCDMLYTDIMNAYYGLPGDLLH